MTKKRIPRRTFGNWQRNNPVYYGTEPTRVECLVQEAYDFCWDAREKKQLHAIANGCHLDHTTLRNFLNSAEMNINTRTLDRLITLKDLSQLLLDPLPQSKEKP